jgi:hypothetical protein
LRAAGTLSVLLLGAFPLGAAPSGPSSPADRITFGAGLYDITDGDENTLDLRFEYRWGLRVWALHPWVGLEATADGALYGAVGLLADLPLGPAWVFTPLGGVGLYDEGGGKDLGHAVEFRTQIEFARRLRGDARAAIALSHISNAGIGDSNPGVDLLTIYCSIPLRPGSRDRPKETPP